MIFLPLLRPFIMSLEEQYESTNEGVSADLETLLEGVTHALTRRSTMGIRPLANCFLA